MTGPLYRATREAVAFFREHAGLSYDPNRQTVESGRRTTAWLLAAAEHRARVHGWDVEWSSDWDVDHEREYGYTPEVCECAILRNADGEVLASLGCVDDADDNYRRVVEAELALEAMTGS